MAYRGGRKRGTANNGGSIVKQEKIGNYCFYGFWGFKGGKVGF